MDRSVAIVGGGIAGLVAATDLARAGVRTVLFEAAAELGGRARTHHVGGFSFNQGAHALYNDGAFRVALWRLGVAAPGEGPRLGHASAMANGKIGRLPVSLGSLRATGLLSIGDKLTFGRIQGAILRDRPAGSFAAWLDSQKISPRLRGMVEAVARLATYAHASAEMSAAAVLEQIKLTFGGVIYVDGGWSMLIDGLARAAREGGADLKTGAAVASVKREGEALRIGLADGEVVSADAVLLALGPHEARALLPVASLEQAASEAIPARTNTLELGLERLPDGAETFVEGIDQPLYFSVHSTGAKLAPPGGAMVHVARYLKPGEKPGRDAVTELEAYADAVMPGWRPLERQRRRLIDMPAVSAVPRWDVKRPGVALGDAPGVFIAGDWVGDVGMLSDASAASAQEAARAMLVFLSAQARAAA